jgi:hypothetical protein
LPDGQKVVQVPGVGNIAFPGTMDDASINAAIKQHLASKQTPAPSEKEGFTKSFGATLPGYHEDDPLGAFKDLWAGGKQMLTHPLDSANTLLHGVTDPMQETNQEAIQRLKSPGISSKATGAVEWLESGVPFLGPLLAKAGNQFANKDVGGGLGTTIGAALPFLAPGAMETGAALPKKISSAITEKATPTIQRAMGIGPDLTETAGKDWQSKAADVREQNTAALGKAKANEAAFQSKVDAAKQANEQSKANFVQRQQAITEAQDHAQDFGSTLEKLHQDELAKGKAMFPDVKGTVSADDVVDALKGAKDKLQGSTKAPPVLDRMIKNLTPNDALSQASVFQGAGAGGRDPLVMGKRLSEYPKEFQEKFNRQVPQETRQGYTPPEQTGASSSISYKQLRGLSSELGDEIANGNLAKDERASLIEARSKIDGMTRKLADSEGKLGQFEAARANWKNLERTFHKTWSDQSGVASPIAKALQMRNPATGELLPSRIMDWLSKDNNYSLAQQMLQKYGAQGSDTLQLMKENMDMAKGLPSKITEKPVPERSFTPVNMKAPPDMPNPQALKAEALNKKAETLGGFSGRGMFIDSAAIVHTLTTGNPLALSIPIGRRLLAKAMRSGAKGSLIGVTPEEMEVLNKAKAAHDTPTLKPSQVYPSAKVAAKAASYQPSEKAATMSGKTKELGPEFSAQQWQEEITRNKAILRNPKATTEEKAIAKDRLRDAEEGARKQ